MPKGISKNPEETKRKMSLRMKGNTFRKGKTPWIAGKKHTSVTKEKMSKAKLGTAFHKGYNHSSEAKLKMSESLKKIYAEQKANGIMRINWKGGYENTLHLNRLRYWKKKEAGGLHTLEQWQELKKQYDFACPSCFKKEPEIILTVDHIIPISKQGTSNIENIQPLCKLCNLLKSTKLIEKFPIPARK